MKSCTGKLHEQDALCEPFSAVTGHTDMALRHSLTARCTQKRSDSCRFGLFGFVYLVWFGHMPVKRRVTQCLLFVFIRVVDGAEYAPTLKLLYKITVSCSMHVLCVSPTLSVSPVCPWCRVRAYPHIPAQPHHVDRCWLQRTRHIRVYAELHGINQPPKRTDRSAPEGQSRSLSSMVRSVYPSGKHDIRRLDEIGNAEVQ